MRYLVAVWLLPRNLAIAFMKGYRKFISPLYGEVCRYWPTCSRYALEVFQQRGFIEGSVRTIWRLLRCNPWSSGGVDDPPPHRNRQLVLNRYGFVVWRSPEANESMMQKGKTR
ncbi:membrane protein insertion efficiency factor YidD [Leucobacter sp. UCMA 4100]|uniref:membrane protein insertion efficiency factor YidD n=1 Tax=Leucobacter sp. UCMA 4100 TaxID=2810534 RepID=UPI0022EAD23C|nr:membrane protein insertion efficiency factor YidD [Leucobacter sp. UCMA 4100]MDA3147053.1 membrane protein insertion efficiency factor YidD [Leucobacter sp. UCMA 4100]